MNKKAWVQKLHEEMGIKSLESFVENDANEQNT